MEYMKTMEVCECGGITYTIKEHFASDGEQLQSLLERIVIKQINGDTLE